MMMKHGGLQLRNGGLQRQLRNPMMSGPGGILPMTIGNHKPHLRHGKTKLKSNLRKNDINLRDSRNA